MNKSISIRTIGQTNKSLENFVKNPKLMNRLHDLTKLKKTSCKRVGSYLHRWIGDYLVQYGNDQKLDRSKFMVLATDRSTGKIVGAAGVILRRRSVFVDFICSSVKTVGSRMMHLIERIGKRRGKKGVELVSVPQATGFYIKRGYRRGPLTKTNASRANAVTRYKHAANAWKKLNPTNMHDKPHRFVDAIRQAARMFPDTVMKKHFSSPAAFYAYLNQVAPGQYKRGFRGKMYLNNNEFKYGLPK
ncbi:GNAT family N-acetyltransferase, partial [bacterium]|nr:GNAT family N-acetyltransferase [bacterium]